MKKAAASKQFLLLGACSVLVLSLLPLLALSPADFASGDDLGYAAQAHLSWLRTHSLPAVLHTAFIRTAQVYRSWQGTWFTVFWFQLHPETFAFNSYRLVPWIVLAMQAAALLFFTHHFLCGRMGKSRSFQLTCFCALFFVLVQFTPNPKYSVYWWTGAIHYMLPFSLGLCAVTAADRFMDRRNARDLIALLLAQTCLGGCSYQSALLTPLIIAVLFFWRLVFRTEKGRRLPAFRARLPLLVPLAAELTGLIISMRAPGNLIRGGEHFGFHASDAAMTVLACFPHSAANLAGHLRGRPGAFLLLLGTGLTLLHLQCRENAALPAPALPARRMRPLLFTALLYLIYAASFAPEIYSAVDVSNGVYDTYFYILMLGIGAAVLYWGEWAVTRGGRLIGRRAVWLSSCAVLLLLFFSLRRTLKSTTLYNVCSYIASGEAADYYNQMQEQHALLTGSAAKDIVLPQINDRQGPLMHMPVTDDPHRFTNFVTAEFYGKKSVIAIPREEWSRAVQNQSSQSGYIVYNGSVE
ncbi:DUF6056 family protein [Lachnoclostridium sp. Marseille-P6806]|uniref:DUF6056 family protein n=1 Tax=Lachnoclostridium sp. Marseille-P6806 TaxID=2364793 RepID=UPI00103123BE|nr:DUF6056 family protein [Lachnoclostridium sp. Marseille-P6806]